MAVFALLPGYKAADAANLLTVRRMTAGALRKLRAIGAIGSLAQAANDPDPGLQRAAETALFATLPELSPDDYGRVGLTTVPNLCRLLNRPDLILVTAVLEALAKIGDSRALEPVQFVARTRKDSAGAIAQSIVPILKARKDEEMNPKLLLRPSRAEDKGSLLQPVQHNASSNSEILLRASRDVASSEDVGD